MKLRYLANARIPTEKAHGLQIVKMCEAFAQHGLDVELLVPFRRQSPQMRTQPQADLCAVKTIWEYYDVATPFALRRLPTPDWIPLDRWLPSRAVWLLYALQSLLFAAMAIGATARAADCYYTRDWYALCALALTKCWHKRLIVFEAHEMHGAARGHGLLRGLLRRVDRLVVITAALKTFYVGFDVAPERILVAADGIDERRLRPPLSRAAARHQLGLPDDQIIIAYTGHLFRWKGVYTLVEAMRSLPDKCWLYIVGGMEPDCRALQTFISAQGLERIVLVGHVPYHAVPPYLAAADALALPNSATDAISRECTSPLKLFEYMAAQRPIVASDLPSLREVLAHDRNAWLTRPDDPRALAEGLRRVVEDRNLARRLVDAAYADVQAYTWRQRAARIWSHVQTV